MMPEFMGQHVSFGKISGRAETALEFVIEAKVDINLLVSRAIEGAGGGARRAAAGVGGIAKEHQLGMAIRNALLGKNFRPRLLRIIQDKGDKFYCRLFTGVTGAVRLRDRRTSAAAGAQKGKQIAIEDKAEDEQNQHAADANVHP